MPHLTRIPVRFGDVDPALIAYYPSLLHLLHAAFEDLIEAATGVHYARLVSDRGIGFPTVHLECDFRAPFRYGDSLEVRSTIPELGRTSALFVQEVGLVGSRETHATTRIRRVAVDMATLAPVPIPDDLRQAFATLAT